MVMIIWVVYDIVLLTLPRNAALVNIFFSHDRRVKFWLIPPEGFWKEKATKTHGFVGFAESFGDMLCEQIESWDTLSIIDIALIQHETC